MENPADIFSTGIPMSEKGNFDHNKYGCDDSSTAVDDPLIKYDDHDYPNNSQIILRDSTCDNVQFINNSIQDGFQSEILCSFECDAGLRTDLPIGENSLQMGSVSESETHINFTDSPGASFHEKIESFSSVEGLVPSLDEQLDSYLLSDFKPLNKNPSEDGDHTLEEEQRNVTEAICDIAKSFGLEDLLPDTFQVDGGKDGLCVTISTDDICSGDAENIGDLSLGDFDKCPDLHSPSSLNLVEQLDADSYVLNGLDMLAPRDKSFDGCMSPKFLLKEDQSKLLLNSKELVPDEVVVISQNKESEDEIEVTVSEDIQSNQPSEFCEVSSSYIEEENVCDVTEDIGNDIPTVSISDVQLNDTLTAIDKDCPPAGSVLIKTDKISKKMQIVVTLEQGQQVYDIDTESVDASHQPIDLDFPSFSDKLPESEQINTSNDANVIAAVEQVDVSPVEEERVEVIENIENEVVESPALKVFVPNVPTIIPPWKIKTWICPVEDCGVVVDRESKLRVHMINHKGARPFKCSFDGCDWAFTTFYRLKRHIETHLGSKDFVCDFEGCNRKFTTVYNLKTHKKRHKRPNVLECPSKDCNMSFANRRKMELHLRVHQDVEAPYKCSLCGKQYYSANCIASHYRTHQYNEDDFKCPFQGCGKVYDKICRLRQHIRHHTGDRPYTCPAEGCKWSFMSASKLTRHMRKHTGERKFVCTEPGCGKSFMRPEHLKGHTVIHSGDKPFHCPHENCNARFTAKSSLYVHVKKHCPSVLKVVYPCPAESCIKKYNSKATLKQHLQKVHPEMIQDGKPLNIAEKLELTMPVSVVNPSENLNCMDLDEFIADDPGTDLQVELFQPTPPLSLSSAITLNTEPFVLAPDTNSNSKSKLSKAHSSKNQSNSASKETTKSQKNKEPLKFKKLTHTNWSGCARTDYCCNQPVKVPETNNFIFLNCNSNDNNEIKNYLIGNGLSEIKSPDIMLTSSIIYNELSSEQLIKNHFSPDSSSTSHSLYHDDSILVSSSSFGQELIPVSLLSDGVDSDESGLNHTSTGIVFSEQNNVDAFGESIDLHGLD